MLSLAWKIRIVGGILALVNFIFIFILTNATNPYFAFVLSLQILFFFLCFTFSKKFYIRLISWIAFEIIWILWLFISFRLMGLGGLGGLVAIWLLLSFTGSIIIGFLGWWNWSRSEYSNYSNTLRYLPGFILVLLFIVGFLELKAYIL